MEIEKYIKLQPGRTPEEFLGVDKLSLRGEHKGCTSSTFLIRTSLLKGYSIKETMLIMYALDREVAYCTVHTEFSNIIKNLTEFIEVKERLLRVPNYTHTTNNTYSKDIHKNRRLWAQQQLYTHGFLESTIVINASNIIEIPLDTPSSPKATLGTIQAYKKRLQQEIKTDLKENKVP